MAMQLGALRDALVRAGAGDDYVARAAEEVATYDTRLSSIDTRLAVLTWMVGATFAGVVAIVLKLFMH